MKLGEKTLEVCVLTSLILPKLGQNSTLIKNDLNLDFPQYEYNGDTSCMLVSRKVESGPLFPLLVYAMESFKC